MTQIAASPEAIDFGSDALVPGGLLGWERNRFDRVAASLNLGPATICALHCADRSLIVEIPLARDDGSMTVLNGYRVQHSSALGPAKGGTRFRPGVHLDDVTALARLMTWKTALHGLPFGGAKGGVDCDPAAFSIRELREMIRLYTLGILPIIGSEVDVPAPDVGTGERTMAWMAHTAAEAGRCEPGIVTGKPVLLGGSLFRAASTGVGVAHVAHRAWEHLGGTLDKSRVVIEGFGAVGYWAAVELQQRDARIVGLSDVTGAITANRGLDPVAVRTWVDAGNELVDYPAADVVRGSVLAIDCDIAIPAAIEGTVTGALANAMSATLVVEGANGPTTPTAETVLQRRGIAVVPDLMANGGGVISSYFEVGAKPSTRVVDRSQRASSRPRSPRPILGDPRHSAARSVARPRTGHRDHTRHRGDVARRRNPLTPTTRRNRSCPRDRMTSSPISDGDAL